jgi:hypothetical protein
MSLRIDINELPEDLRLALAAGDTMEFESDGELLARAERCFGPVRISWEEYFALRRSDPALDLDEFERDLRRFRGHMNRPMEPSPWE